jgi:hypothetical protein
MGMRAVVSCLTWQNPKAELYTATTLMRCFDGMGQFKMYIMFQYDQKGIQQMHIQTLIAKLLLPVWPLATLMYP